MAQNLTEVRLLSVPLENDYLHTIYFGNNVAEQTNYFKGKTLHIFTDCSYQRKDMMIRVSKHIDDIIKCNYVMYRNSAYTSKWYYAFITKMEYKDDGRTDVYIETDVMQTWLPDSDYIVKSSFVEREHCKDDTIGTNTIPEQLELGDYVINAKNKNASLLAHKLIIGCTVNLNDGGKYEGVSGGMYNGIYSGIKYYCVTHDEANTIIKGLAKAGKSDAIQCIFMCPSIFVSSITPELGTYPEVENGLNAIRKDWLNTVGVEDTPNYKPTNLNGYTPRNNKLFTYPYCYMSMTNNSGASAVYKYELFNNPNNKEQCDFYIYSSITPGMSIKISPRYYNNVDINNYESLNLGKFPICGWNSDVYTNWLTQNGINIGISTISSISQVASGVVLSATGGGALAGAGMVTSGLMGVAQTIGEVYQHSLQPPQAEGNVNSGDVTFSSQTLTFTAYQMTIKKEFAEIIDGYFDMFGYKTNKVKVPLKNHRRHWWYTKTIDVNIDGAIPQEDMRKIKECYNKGITFWRPNSIGDYSLDNYILTSAYSEGEE